MVGARPDLVFLYGQSVPRCTHRIDKEFREYQTLQYMSGGGVELRIGEERYELRGRNFWSGYGGVRIGFHVAEGFEWWRHRFVAFRGAMVSRWVAEGLFPVARPQRPPGRREYGGRFDRMLELSSRGDRVSQLRAIHLLEGMLVDLAEARAAEVGVEAWLTRALDRLAAVGEGGGVADYAAIAEELGMGESTFRRRFREGAGVSPHVYLLQCRVGAARRLLAGTDLAIKEIAGRLGYGDVYFFSRQFKQMAGVPPAVYRRSRQG